MQVDTCIENLLDSNASKEEITETVQQLRDAANNTGISTSQLRALIGLILTSKLASPSKSSIIKYCLIVRNDIPNKIIMTILFNLGLNTSINGNLQVDFLSWILSNTDKVDSKVIERMSGYIFNLLNIDYLRPSICELLYLGKSDNLKKWRLEYLDELYDKSMNDKHLGQLIEFYNGSAPTAPAKKRRAAITTTLHSLDSTAHHLMSHEIPLQFHQQFKSNNIHQIYSLSILLHNHPEYLASLDNYVSIYLAEPDADIDKFLDGLFLYSKASRIFLASIQSLLTDETYQSTYQGHIFKFLQLLPASETEILKNYELKFLTNDILWCLQFLVSLTILFTRWQAHPQPKTQECSVLFQAHIDYNKTRFNSPGFSEIASLFTASIATPAPR